MITLTYGQLRDPSFHRALTTLANQMEIKSGKTRMNIALVYGQAMDAWKQTDEEFKEIMQEFAQKEDDGEFVRVPGGREDQVILNPSKVKEFNGADAEFRKKIYQINRPLIALKDLSEIEMSPADISVLSHVLDFDGVEA